MKYISHIISLFILSVLVSQAQTPAELKSWLPQVEGWTLSEKVEVFSPDNLFDRINGAAPLFLENNFREMTAMEYAKGDDNITIQAYRHASPEDAFGMYASERSSDLTFFPIGGEAQGDNTNVYFFAGNMYVKIWSNSSDNSGNVLKTIAEALSEKIMPDAKYPPVVNTFPKENKIPYSDAYITSNYIGHQFLKAVYTANYKKDDQAYQIFVIDSKTENDAKELLKNYFTFTKQPLDFGEGELIIKDKYNGNMPAVWKGRYIVGIFSENGDPIPDSAPILNKLIEELSSL